MSPLIAYRALRCAAVIRSLSAHSGHCSALAFNGRQRMTRNMVHGDIGSNKQSGFGRLAAELGTLLREIYWSFFCWLRWNPVAVLV